MTTPYDWPDWVRPDGWAYCAPRGIAFEIVGRCMSKHGDPMLRHAHAPAEPLPLAQCRPLQVTDLHEAAELRCGGKRREFLPPNAEGVMLLANGPQRYWVKVAESFDAAVAVFAAEFDGVICSLTDDDFEFLESA
ncbi:MAG: hypothetical protein AAFV72_00030 [Cyanobacteria bacterium J06635_1]